MNANGKWRFSSLLYSILFSYFYLHVKISNTNAQFEGLCPKGWTSIGPLELCIQPYPNYESWYSARRFCKSLGGDLLTVLNDDMKSFIWSVLKPGEYWIGLVYHTQVGQPKWIHQSDKADGGHGVGERSQIPTDGVLGKRTHGCALLTRSKHSKVTERNEDCSEEYLFVCERVFVCANQKHGKDCSRSCSRFCAGSNKMCAKQNGACLFGCENGYEGAACESACDNQTYGENCSQRCSPHCGGPDKACHNVDGSCVSGCDVGYQGDKCDTACDNQTYGENCSQRCSPHCGGPDKACHNVDGSCMSGCDVGYQGDKCDTDVYTREKKTFDASISDETLGLGTICSNQTYGANCSQSCSPYCAGPGRECDDANGSCVSGCDFGYQGDKCDTVNTTPVIAPVPATADVTADKRNINNIVVTAVAALSIFLITCLVLALIIVGGTVEETRSIYKTDSFWSRQLEPEEGWSWNMDVADVWLGPRDPEEMPAVVSEELPSQVDAEERPNNVVALLSSGFRSEVDSGDGKAPVSNDASEYHSGDDSLDESFDT